MMPLADEQQAIVAWDLQPRETLKIMAFAGTGKTATLVAYTQARPHMRFLYIAFNKSVLLEAAAKFPSNVVARTSHALAFRTHGHPHKDRITSGFGANTIMQALGLKCHEDARFAIDTLNNCLELAKDVDGFVFGSPVHYAAASGAMTSFMDCAFYTDLQGCKKSFYLKPAAAVLSARRAGTTAAFDQLNKYFTITEMPVISSRYWNMVHGAKPEDVKKDLEGLQIMRVLARNMAWFLKCMEAGKKAGVPLPSREDVVITNFIRE